MKKIYFILGIIGWSLGVSAQVSLTNGSPTVAIDFSSSTPTTVGTSPSTAFTSAGFESNPTTAGRLNSNAWAVTGWSDGALAFGGTRTTAATDYTRGATAVAITTGGMYAYTGAPGSAANPSLMIQPGGSDWAPGTLTLRIQNNGSTNITDLAVSYNLYIRNDQNRSSSFNFSYSTDDVTYTPVAALDYTSPAALDAAGWVIVGSAPSRSTTISSLNIAPGSYIYIRWSGADVGGSGSRDEFGLDDIGLTATFGSGGTPDIVLSSPSPAVAAGNIAQGSSNNPIYRFDLAVTTASATLTGVTINTSGTYASTDLINLKCWYSSDNVFNPGTDVLLSTKTTGLGAGTQVFPSFTNQSIASGSSGYFFITADVTCTAVPTNTITVNAITTADLAFLSGNVSGTAFAGGIQTVVTGLPNNVTGPSGTVANTQTVLSWVNPTACYDEIMIVGAAGSTNLGTPTGDGTAYTPNNIFGSGTGLSNGFVLYKGTSSPQTVTNLVNGTTYYFKFFTRLGTTWSSGIEITVTPAAVSSPTDYFRSVASGSWPTIGIWESSNDSTSWIPATLAPGALAAHVTVRSPDSVYLAANTTTINLTVNSGAVVNALNFSMTATLRFNLLGTATFYQGGTITAVPGVQQVLSTTSNYHYNGTQAGTSASLPAFGNLYWEPTASGAGTFVNNTLTAPFNGGLVVRGDLTINIQGGTAREIRFATGNLVSRTHTIDGNLNVISSSSTVVFQNGTNAVTSIVNIGGSINISAGIIQGTSSTAATNGNAVVNLSGSIFNTGGTIQTGASTAGLFNLNFVGTASQSINNASGTYSFTANQNITINNSSAAGVTLNTPISLPGNLTLTLGNLNTTSVNLLTLGAASAVSGASNASYVNGPLSKIGNTAFTFPVGKNNCGPSGTVKGMAALNIANFAGSAPTDQFTAEYMRGDALALGSTTMPLGLDHISRCDYWTLNLVNGTPTVDLTLYWDETINNCISAAPYVNNLSSLTIAHFNGTNWNSYGVAGNTTGTTTAGTVTWTGVSTFSPFSIGSIDFLNPLPISVHYLNGGRQGNNHLLSWAVSCGIAPRVTMYLERSSDGVNFSSIYSLTADAVRCASPFDYTDAQPLKGPNYYRLRTVDIDGKPGFSNTVLLLNASSGMEVLKIAPNPVTGSSFKLGIATAKAAMADVRITDMQGRVMFTQRLSLSAGFNNPDINVSRLAPGMYNVTVLNNEEKTAVVRLVKQ